jgi:hypothetical protein
MRCRAATILLMLSLWGAPALAGPWARSEGEGFVSLTVTADTDGRALWSGTPMAVAPFTSLYGEYGLGRGLTSVARLGRSDTMREADLILRYTLTEPGAAWQVALDGGVSLRGADPRGLVRIGASIGRGFGAMEARRWWWPVAHDAGWGALALSALHDPQTAATAWEAEVTLGLALSDRLSVMVQLKAEDPADADGFITVMPGATLSLSDRSTVQIGARLGGYDGNRAGLSLGLWHRF